MAQQTIVALESAGADWVVSPANSCVAMLLHEYPDLFAGDPTWRACAQHLAERTADMATFLDSVARLPDGALADHRDSHAYTYHPFCQTRTVLGGDGAARRLLERVCAIELRELPELAVCCGFGGSTSFTAPELGRGMALRKLENVDTSGATVVVSDNPGCLLHLRGAAVAAGRASLRFEHLVEVLARRVDTLA